MSDDSAAGTAKPRANNDEIIEDAVVVDETVIVDDATGTPIVVEEATTSESEPVVATDDPGAAETATTAEPVEPAHRVVYVQVPAAPKKLGNRGIGTLVAVVAALVFTLLFALIGALISAGGSGRFSFAFLTRAEFYIPTLFFLIGFVLLVLILNRASWWTFIIGSLLVGLFVYFGTIGLSLLNAGIVQETPAAAADLFRAALGSPTAIVAGLLAREVALWTGAIISRRGRRLRERNLENRAAYDRELAISRAEHERANAAAAPTA
jgi:hypothetical protein